MSDDDILSFERYDDEFSSIMEQIRTSLAQQPPGTLTRNLLQQCDDLIQQMALEARSVSDSAVKRTLLQKVRTYKSEWQTVSEQSEKQGLLEGAAGTGGGGDNSNSRQYLQKNEDTLHSQNDTLERARRTMQETEQVALEITEELGNNREKLMSAHGRVKEVGGMTGRARRILFAMSKRQMQQKMIMYGVAVALVLVFIILLYSMWRG
jgi:predicted RND superfamily exporter protein